MARNRIPATRAPEEQQAPRGTVRAWAALFVCAIVFLYAFRVLGGLFLERALFAVVESVPFIFLWLVAGVGWGSGVLRTTRMRHRFGIVLGLAVRAGMGIGCLSLLVLGCGLAGVLSVASSWLIIVVGVGLALWEAVERRAEPVPRFKAWLDRPVTGWALLWTVAMPALAVATVASQAPPGLLWGDEPNGYDVVGYHLQVPREWFEAGRIRALPHNVYSYLPFNVEMHYLFAMHLRGGPWAGMYVAQSMHVTMTALAVFAAWAVARRAGGGGGAIVGAVIFAVAPWLMLLAPVAYNEGGVLLFGTLAIGLVWLELQTPITSAHAPPSRRAWALAGAFAGFACGVKLTALPMLAIGVPVALLAAAMLGRRGASAGDRPEMSNDPLSASVRRGGLFVVFAIITFSPWALRNIAWAGGNPFFPEATEVLGRGRFSLVQQERWRRAHSPREDQRSLPGRLRSAAGQVAFDWRFGWAPLPMALVAIALSLRPSRWGRPGPHADFGAAAVAGHEARAIPRPGDRRAAVFLLALLVVFSIVWLFFTHLQGRFFVLALPVCALAIAMLTGPLRAAAGAVAVVAALLGWSGWSDRYFDRPTSEPGILRSLVITQALGVPSLDGIVPLDDLGITPDDTLVLIGDARAFFYTRAMTRLRYRTVFDVDSTPGESAIDAWQGGASPPGGGPRVLLIDPNELRRLARTYWMIPPMPDELRSRPDPFILRHP